MIHLTDYVGEPATYEHLAEEASELAKAALKYARYLRGENPLDPNTNPGVLRYNIKEEVTDVLFLIEELDLNKDNDEIWLKKTKRTMERLIDAGKTRNNH